MNLYWRRVHSSLLSLEVFEMTRFILLLAPLAILIDSTCFESSSTSQLPREFLRKETGIWTSGGCRALCINATECLAVQFSETTKSCNLLGAAKTDGAQCGTVFSLFLKKSSCTNPLPQPDPGAGFSSTGCQDAADIVDITLGAIGNQTSCPPEMTPAGKQPYIVDVVLSNGLRDFYPSNKTTVVWDADVGSFKLASFADVSLFKSVVLFVSYARCARAPGTPSSSCTCGAVPPTGPQNSQTDEVTPYLNVLPSCPSGYNLWVFYLFETGSQPAQTPSIQYRIVFCGMNTWFMWYLRAFEEVYRISEASCLRMPTTPVPV